MSDLHFLPVRSTQEIAAVAALASQIWRQHYPSIISRAQIDYMLNELQSPDAIAKQIATGVDYYLVENKGEDIGYFAYALNSPRGKLFLSKIYLKRCARGKGFAREILAFLEKTAAENTLTAITLTVNKQNPSVEIYQKLGFVITASLLSPIGETFVLDDYRMEKPIEGRNRKI